MSEQDLIRELAKLLDETNLTEIEVEREGLRVRVARQIMAGKALPLRDGINPAWAAAVGALTDSAVKPLLGDKSSLTSLTEADWAALQAKLRAVHLRAHLETRPVLSAQQITHYDQLRGYTTGSPQEHGQQQRH